MDNESDIIYDDFECNLENINQNSRALHIAELKINSDPRQTNTKNKQEFKEFYHKKITEDSKVRRSFLEEMHNEKPIAMNLNELRTMFNRANSVSDYSFSGDFESESEKSGIKNRYVEMRSGSIKSGYVSSPKDGDSFSNTMEKNIKQINKNFSLENLAKEMAQIGPTPRPEISNERLLQKNLNTEIAIEIKSNSFVKNSPNNILQKKTKKETKIENNNSKTLDNFKTEKNPKIPIIEVSKMENCNEQKLDSKVLSLAQLYEEKKLLNEKLKDQNEELTKMVEEQGYKNVLNKLKENKNDFKSRPIEIKTNTYQREINNNEKIM